VRFTEQDLSGAVEEAELAEGLDAGAGRLLDEALALADRAPPHRARQLVDEARAFGKILAGHGSFHLPLHLRQLEALISQSVHSGS
jgi:hypothetical protein